ncbi:MAG: GntR family transcriptional regulator [Chloroflexi bacterium]|nr:MAG: GntR family transcriptional regulator [Chloroflexota bacterium]
MADTMIYHTIPEQIAARLRQDILSGRLKPNQPLREKEVAEWFGVSRGPVREVFRQLTQEGVLIAEPNKGVRVAPQPSDSVRPLLVELRKTIECYVLSSIFEKITQNDIAHWEDILEELRIACEKGDTAAMVEHDLAFHSSLIRSHDEKDLFALWQPIAMRMLIHYNRLGDLMDSYREHRAILDAIKKGDKASALKALEFNIQ